MIEATGSVYPEAERFLAGVKRDLEQQHAAREHVRSRQFTRTNLLPHELKNIDLFRADGRYSGDGTRVDLAYAIYALSHGANAEQVEAGIRSRDLSHKGNVRRQDDYIARTIKKALAAIELGR